MSWEGYIQAICANGHLISLDPYHCMYNEEKEKCHCGAEIAWENTVDQTNDQGFPFPVEVLVIEQAQECKCPTCGHQHTTMEAKYRPPIQQELDEYYKAEKQFYESLQNRFSAWEE